VAGHFHAVVEAIYPAKLRRGDEIRVIAPSISRAMVTEYDQTAIIERRFATASPGGMATPRSSPPATGSPP
jgi:hypothetical protein